MDHRMNPEAGGVAQARALLAAAADGVARLESAAHQAFCRLAALAGMQARLEGLVGSCEPTAAEAAALAAATVCREARVLLRYIRSGGACPMGGAPGRGSPLPESRATVQQAGPGGGVAAR